MCVSFLPPPPPSLRERRMIDYVYVHNCLKLDSEVKVQIIEQHRLPRSLECEVKCDCWCDDQRDLRLPQPQSFSVPPAPPPWALPSSFHSISAQELNNLLDSYVSKATKFRNVVRSQREMVRIFSLSLSLSLSLCSQNSV